jgi:hypothetical protein
MREDYIFADREVVGSYGLRAQSEREPPFCTLVVIDWQVGEHVPNDRSARTDPERATKPTPANIRQGELGGVHLTLCAPYCTG